MNVWKIYDLNITDMAIIKNTIEIYLFPFMKEVITNLKTLGRVRTSETYTSTLNSFKCFRENKDVALDNMDAEMMRAYESYLKIKGVTPNTSSFYMRNLRAVYNRAVEKGLTNQRFPFKHVYTGVDKTQKRAVPLDFIKQIKQLELPSGTSLDLARDMFLFSFYTRGMSFIDMAYLKKKDLSNGILSYRRRKTGQQLFIKWEKCMQKIVDKHDTGDSVYLLPIIHSNTIQSERSQYLNAGHKINRSLKRITRLLEVPFPLTMYVARHAWASIAKSQNIPISVISEGMGHDSETTTRIYLASLDNSVIDEANKRILNLL